MSESDARPLEAEAATAGSVEAEAEPTQAGQGTAEGVADDRHDELKVGAVEIQHTPVRRPGSRGRRSGGNSSAAGRLSALREEGQPWEAMLGFRQLAEQIEHEDKPTVEEQAAWIGAVREEMEASLQCGLVEESAARLVEAMSWFGRPHWGRWRKETSQRFNQLIQMAVRVGRDDDALDLLQKARGMVSLSEETRTELARSAARIGRCDLGAAELYLHFLRTVESNARQYQRVLEMLRKSIRIDLVSPEEQELAKFREMNERLWKIRRLPWCAAHQALAAVRQGRRQEAWALREAAVDIEEADADTLVLLGVVSYLTGHWRDAEGLFQRACERAGPDAGLHTLYLPMARLNTVLAGGEMPQQRETCIDRLKEDAASIAAIQPESRTALDAEWLRGAVCSIVGQDEEALAAFERAPQEFLCWRYVRAEADVLTRLGKTAELAERLEQHRQHSPEATRLVRLVTAAGAISRLAWEDARGMLAAAEPAGDADVDGTAEAARQCIQMELALCAAEPCPNRPELPVPVEGVSAELRSHLGLLQARWHLDRGEMDHARTLLEEPIHWIAQPGEVARWKATVEASNGNDEAGPAFAALAERPHAPAVDRLHWGLWLCGQGEHRRGREVLEPVAAEAPDCLELILARVEIELAEGGDPQEARRLVDGLEKFPDWVHLPRAAAYRPWMSRLPASIWSRSAQVSMARVADMLQAAHLMIHVGRAEPAMIALARVEHLLGKLEEQDGPIAQELARLYREGCVREMAAGHLELACQLQMQAARFQAGDRNFAVEVAEVIADRETPPADEVLDILCGFVATVDGDQAVNESRVGQVLCRVLHIDRATVERHGELSRRKAWTERLRDVRPGWDWPKRNLAREAELTGHPQQAFELADSLAAPEADDLALKGRAAWHLERFPEAFDAFTGAISAGGDDAPTRAWRGCAQAATRFRQWIHEESPPQAEECDALTGDLAWDGCDGALAVRVRVWHGAVLVAGGRGAPALAALDLGDGEQADEDDHRAAVVLRGLARLQAGDVVEALAAWNPGDESLDEPLQLALHALLLQLQPAAASRREAAEAISLLRKRGAANQAFHLAVGHQALNQDDLALARETADAAAAEEAARGLPLVLAPLRQFLRHHCDLLLARLVMREGQLNNAAEVLTRLEADALMARWARYWRAACDLAAGRGEQAEILLTELAQGDPPNHDARAQLALAQARSDRGDLARQNAEAVLAADPDHPFALLAKAEACEGQGDPATAMTVYGEAVEKAGQAGARRVLAAAHLARGRLAQWAGQPEAAESELRQAIAAHPDQPLANKRLGLVLAVCAEDEPRLAEAEQLLKEVAAQEPDSAVVAVARAVVAQRQSRVEEVAGELARLVGLADFQNLDPETRSAVALWSADVQLLQRRYGAAGAALKELAAHAPSPEIEGRMIQCFLLEALEKLQEVPLSQGSIQQSMEQAQAVLARRPDYPLGLLIFALCRVLAHGPEDEEARRLAGRLGEVELPEGQQRVVAGMVRHLVGDPDALTEIEPALGAGETSENTRHCLELLLANQTNNLAKLVAEANRLVKQTENGEADLALDADELVLVGALGALAQRQEAQAARLLETWHDRKRGTPRTRSVHSQLLARQVIRSLRAKDLPKTVDTLGKALAVLSPETPGG